MLTFDDKSGNTHSLALTLGTVEKIKQLLTLDILEGEDITRMFLDVRLLVNAAYVAARENGTTITDEEFGKAIDGKALDALAAAMEAALLDFFPATRKSALTVHLQQLRKAEEVAADELDKVTETDAMEVLMRNRIREHLGNLSLN